MNYIAVLVAGILNMVIGALWYGPLFGKQWMKLMKMSPKDAQAPGKAYAINFVATLVTAFMLSSFIGSMGAITAASGMMISFLAWLGFVATIMLGEVLWGGKPVKLYAINAGYQLVVFLIMGAIFGVW